MPKRDREAVSQGLSQILGGSDLLGSVIRSDRQRAGRPVTPLPADEKPEAPTKEDAAETQDVMTSHNVIVQYDNKAIGQADNTASKQSDNRTSGQTDKQES